MVAVITKESEEQKYVCGGRGGGGVYLKGAEDTQMVPTIYTDVERLIIIALTLLNPLQSNHGIMLPRGHNK